MVEEAEKEPEELEDKVDALEHAYVKMAMSLLEQAATITALLETILEDFTAEEKRAFAIRVNEIQAESAREIQRAFNEVR